MPPLTGQRLLAQRRRVHGGRRRDDVLGRRALSGARQLRQQLRLQRRLRLALGGRRLTRPNRNRCVSPPQEGRGD